MYRRFSNHSIYIITINGQKLKVNLSYFMDYYASYEKGKNIYKKLGFSI